MKKILPLFIWAMLIMMTTLSANGTNKNITVIYNGQAMTFDQAPEMVNSRTMVPVRAIFEALGMTVDWAADTQTITGKKEGLAIQLTIGSLKAVVGGDVVLLDAAAYIKNGRTLVPLRFIAESTGADVAWDGTTYTVSILSGEGYSDDGETKEGDTLPYAIVDTGLEEYFTDFQAVPSIGEGSDFYGQDANYDGNQPSYRDNGDGTVTDLVTGLMWQQTMDTKMSYDEAVAYANKSALGGYNDWRIPNIKELFSLIMFYGRSSGESAGELYMDTDYFNQPIGDISIGERKIDAQVWSSTFYAGKTMNGDETLFGVNFVDGRIKGYPTYDKRAREPKKLYFRLVRGNESYGENNFIDNGDGTVTDLATGLMWQLADDGQTRDWKDALAYAEGLTLAGYDDWRLPDIKELQSIVDYTRSPQTTNSPAINPLFSLTEIIDEKGDKNYGFYWSGTTHQDGKNTADAASYVAFGEALGQMFGQVMDVHGAGAVRSDPKGGDSSDYPAYRGPQGDIQYKDNYVLAVRRADVE